MNDIAPLNIVYKVKISFEPLLSPKLADLAEMSE